MLQEIITDKNFVWDKFSLNNTNFLINISEEAINELKKNRSLLQNEDISRSVTWKLKLFEFSNMFSYGEDNVALKNFLMKI